MLVQLQLVQLAVTVLLLELVVMVMVLERDRGRGRVVQRVRHRQQLRRGRAVVSGRLHDGRETAQDVVFVVVRAFGRGVRGSRRRRTRGGRLVGPDEAFDVERSLGHRFAAARGDGGDAVSVTVLVLVVAAVTRCSGRGDAVADGRHHCDSNGPWPRECAAEPSTAPVVDCRPTKTRRRR